MITPQGLWLQQKVCDYNRRVGITTEGLCVQSVCDYNRFVILREKVCDYKGRVCDYKGKVSDCKGKACCYKAEVYGFKGRFVIAREGW